MRRQHSIYTATIQFSDGARTDRTEWARSYDDMKKVLSWYYEPGTFEIISISGPEGIRYYHRNRNGNQYYTETRKAL